MVAGGDNGDRDGDGQNRGNAPDDAASQAAARSLQDLLARLPVARNRADAGVTPADVQPVGAPLRTNREYNGLDVEEPVAPALAQSPGQSPGQSPAPSPAPARIAATAAAASASAGETLAPPRPDADQGSRPSRREAPVLPRRATRISTGRIIWFVMAFVAPVLLGAAYLFFIMPDQYVTEFRFSVRVPVGNPGSEGRTSNGSSVSALFGGNPTPGTDLLDNFTVADYARSAQAARDLNTKINLKALYSKPSDPFTTLGANVSQERLGRYWKSMVYSDYDVTTGLAVVRVKAFTPQDSLSIANSLLALSTQLVNDIGDQSQGDTVRFASEQVNRAKQQVVDLQNQIAAMSRNGAQSPSIGVIQANTNVATLTRSNIAQIQAQIEVLNNQLHNPEAPQILLLRQELAANERQLAGAVRTANSDTTNAYNVLTTNLANASQVYSSAQAALSYARATAASQRLYLTTYVRPTLPESATAPDRLIDLLLLIVVSGMVWMLGMLVRNSIMEHGL